MATASISASQRVRQIAILVSSVEASVARQLLMHLPTDLAKQVKATIGQLGAVSPVERQAILNEFQRSAIRGGSTATTKTEPPKPQAAAPATSAEPGATSDLGRAHGVESANVPAWTKLSTQALVRFAKNERVAMAAVVVSQLAPAKGVEVLRQLPRETHREILKRLSHLQDIDPSAMAAIDEHLSERLSDYQQVIESEQANHRRLSALLAAAPPELQDEWQQILDEPEVAPTSGDHAAIAPTTASPWNAVANSNVTADPSSNSLLPLADDTVSEAKPTGRNKTPLVTLAPHLALQAKIEELYSANSFTAAAGLETATTNDQPIIPTFSPALDLIATLQHASNIGSVPEPHAIDPKMAPRRIAGVDEAVAEQEAPRSTIPFPTMVPPASTKANSTKASSVQYEAVRLEPLLDLPPTMLAKLLSSMDAPTVLLALAGSSPAFMRRFSQMLHPGDAKALAIRLQQIGSINLRDVDAAQRRLMQHAASLAQLSATGHRKAA